MADRKDWFFRQIVAEDELDEAFDHLEVSDRALVTDAGVGTDDTNPDEFGGIRDGLTPALSSGTDIQVAAGIAYDGQGRRIELETLQTIDVSKDGSTAIGSGGTPSGLDTDPGIGNARWITVFAVYDRLLSDGRVDGNNQTVYFERAESFHLEASAGPTRTVSSLSTPLIDGAPRQVDKILICDVKIQGSISGPVAISIDTSRRESWFNVVGSPQSIERLALRDVLKDILELYNNHVSDLADLHGAGALGYNGGDPWADGTLNPATDVENQLDKIITDLNSTVDSAGAKKIGAKEQIGTLSTPNSTAPLTLSAGTLEAQLAELLDAVNGRVFRGGDSSIDGALLPAATGRTLGSTTQRWDAVFRDLDISGSIAGNLIPSAGSQNIGSLADSWDAGYIDTLNATQVNVSNDLYADRIFPEPLGANKILGALGTPWLEGYVTTLRANTIGNFGTSDLLITTDGAFQEDNDILITSKDQLSLTSGDILTVDSNGNTIDIDGGLVDIDGTTVDIGGTTEITLTTPGNVRATNAATAFEIAERTDAYFSSMTMQHLDGSPGWFSQAPALGRPSFRHFGTTSANDYITFTCDDWPDGCTITDVAFEVSYTASVPNPVDFVLYAFRWSTGSYSQFGSRTVSTSVSSSSPSLFSLTTTPTVFNKSTHMLTLVVHAQTTHNNQVDIYPRIELTTTYKNVSKWQTL